jgi:hypothetical protein
MELKFKGTSGVIYLLGYAAEGIVVRGRRRDRGYSQIEQCFK